MAEEPEISPEQLTTFRRCTFARRVFASYPSLWAKKPLGADDVPPDSPEGEWHVSKPYTGEPLGSMDQSWTAAVALDWLACDRRP